MKMKPEHYEYMATRIKPFDTPQNRALYRANGLTLRRYQWDLIRHARLTYWLCDALYRYLNDDHIQTALNRIVPTLDNTQEELPLDLKVQ